MKQTNLKPILIAALACACLAPVAAAAAQYQNQDDYGRARDHRWGVRDVVDDTSRASKSFRYYFEHNFRANGHEQRWDRSDRYGHPEHEGRYGQMTLKDAIQNMDEDLERLRAEVDHHGRTRYAQSLTSEIQDHSNQVDRRIGAVADGYWFNENRNWRYNRSELFDRWQELRRDISRLDGVLQGRDRF